MPRGRKVSVFFNVDNAAEAIGVSTRHLKRISDEAGVQPMNVGRGVAKKFIWTAKQIEEVRRYWKKHPVPGRK